MKVLHICKYYYPYKGGMETHVYNLCNRLRDKHVNLEVLAFNDGFITKHDIIRNISVTRIASYGKIFSTPLSLSLPLYLSKNGFDIFHIHLPNPIVNIFTLLMRLKNIIVTYHSDIIKYKYVFRIYKPFLLRLLNKVNYIIVPSPITIESSNILSKYKDKCIAIPHGIELKKYNQTELIKKKVNEIKKIFSNRIILFVGRLRYYKGLEYLIKAMKRIDGILLIVGKGNLEFRLKKLVFKLDLNDKIYFLGEIPDEELIFFYHACMVVVLPSIEKSESFGIVQLEAMACYKPVISTNIKTGVSWVNQNMKTGFVIPPKDVNSLSSAINKLINDERLRNRFGENGRKRVEEEFTAELMSNRVVDLYEKMSRNHKFYRIYNYDIEES